MGIELFSLFAPVLCPTCHRLPSERFPQAPAKKVKGAISEECQDPIHDLADEFVRMYVLYVQKDPAFIATLLMQARLEEQDEVYRKYRNRPITPTPRPEPEARRKRK